MADRIIIHCRDCEDNDDHLNVFVLDADNNGPDRLILEANECVTGDSAAIALDHDQVARLADALREWLDDTR